MVCGIPLRPPAGSGDRAHMSKVASPHIALDHSRCDACWECVDACPEAVIGKVDVWLHRHAVIRAGDRCSGCRKCVKICKAGALSVRSNGHQS